MGVPCFQISHFAVFLLVEPKLSRLGRLVNKGSLTVLEMRRNNLLQKWNRAEFFESADRVDPTAERRTPSRPENYSCSSKSALLELRLAQSGNVCSVQFWPYIPLAPQYDLTIKLLSGTPGFQNWQTATVSSLAFFATKSDRLRTRWGN